MVVLGDVLLCLRGAPFRLYKLAHAEQAVELNGLRRAALFVPCAATLLSHSMLVSIERCRVG